MARTVASISREHERQLIERARLREQGAMRELIELHKDRLFAFLWRMIRNHHDAEDICQDAFLKAFASLESFSVQYRFSTWLFTIGYRICLNRLRSKRAINSDPDVFASIPSGDDSSGEATVESREAAELRKTVWQAVDHLSAPQRATVLLFYRHEMSCQEIARILELPVATVKSHLHRARKRLREIIESLSEKELQEFRSLSGLAG